MKLHFCRSPATLPAPRVVSNGFSLVRAAEKPNWDQSLAAADTARGAGRRCGAAAADANGDPATTAATTASTTTCRRCRTVIAPPVRPGEPAALAARATTANRQRRRRTRQPGHYLVRCRRPFALPRRRCRSPCCADAHVGHRRLAG